MIETFLNILPAVQVIFKLGYEPQPHHFREATDEQYKQLHASGFDTSSKLYIIEPDDDKYLTEETLVVSEEEKHGLLEAKKVIENYCDKSEKSFASYDEKLRHVTKLLPSVFTENTPYKASHLRVIGRDEDE